VLAWRLSNTLGADFCVEALEEALARYGRPEIFNTDQSLPREGWGSQFTSDESTTTLKRHEIAISMDGKGRCMDNTFVERLWRSLKYEEVYLNAYARVAEARTDEVKNRVVAPATALTMIGADIEIAKSTP
jgi:putative transposase